MPLPNPILDDRSYQQLRDELVRRIPVYTPEWTDYNTSDPGITLIELFSFLAENLLFRFNQIPEKTKLEYLRLLQIPLRPAAPARALVVMSAESPAGVLVEQQSEAKAGSLPFETQTEVVVWPVSCLAVGRIKVDAPSEPEIQAGAERAIDALGLKDKSSVVYYENATVCVQGTGTPVNFGATVDGMLWVAVLAEKGADASKMGNALLNLGFVPDPAVPSIEQSQPCPGAGAAASRPPVVEWAVSAGLDTDGKPRFRPVGVEGDTTRGLTQQGVVRLRLPRESKDFGAFALSDRDLAGTGDLPPALDDKSEAKVLFWLRAFRQDYSRFGKVQFVGVNATEVVQYAKAGPEYLGTGTGQPEQKCRLIHRSVIEDSLAVEVEETSGWRRWTAVDGFHASGPDDRHYVIDREAGEVQFGNGIQGLPPQIGQRIRALEYRYGGGAEGNVAPKAISKLAKYAAVKLWNPLWARGGAAAESIADALDRIPGELRRRDRAVTTGDFKELALLTPGGEVGRAECLARFHPHTKDKDAAGVVSVVVWPVQDAKHPTAPVPDADLLRSVCRWLDDRRLITTELYVIPPTYRKVAVSIGVKVKPGYGAEAVRRWVELVIRRYLAPLPPYGPSGEGWPLGRDVYGPELEGVALQVEGVEYLEGLNVSGCTDEKANTWKAGTVVLEDWEVPELANITVIEGPPAAKPEEEISPPSLDGKVPVPVPVVRHICKS